MLEILNLSSLLISLYDMFPIFVFSEIPLICLHIITEFENLSTINKSFLRLDCNSVAS